ncbi:MAG: UDP-N-acetylglucosamine 1-carboxyvinyltransferase [Gammaproteobacteria bacterium]|nr:MAG: UDP-N-acetylglucosamine 1-carboxyvinyltransferase [Gammaproteobacteria bacterium]UTW42841.1 UDP-N-acetylglucosamine 1-carboxyvinyltransferase [bacterium SCSIO 12844]
MNDTLIISGGNTLEGTVKISGAKNAALPLLAASLLTEQSVMLCNVPSLTDVEHFKLILKQLGVHLTETNETTTLTANTIKQQIIDFAEAKAMRASVLFLGPLLSRLGEVAICLPGGCNIGLRPIDQHLQALSLMGAEFHINNGIVYAKKKSTKLHGADIRFTMPTVTGTENVIMAATIAEGITTIKNAAKEPEVIDLCKLLNAMGAKIKGSGTSKIQISGVPKLHSACHTIIPDRIETGTYLISALATNSLVELTNTNPKLLTTELNHFRQMGAKISTAKSKIKIYPSLNELIGINLTTQAYPGFSTDLQAPTMLLHSLAKGQSTITENIFDNRFHHVNALNQMNANLNISSNHVFCQGHSKLYASEVTATDLRASACLTIAGLVAEGESYIHHINYLDRGYSQFDKKLQSLGANIKRIATSSLPKCETFARTTLYAS